MAAIGPFFAVDGTLEANGWQLGHPQPADRFVVPDGVVELGCSTTKPNDGLAYWHEVPELACGEFSFEVMLDGAAVHHNDLNLWINIGAHALSFREDGLQRYYPYVEPKWNTVGRHRFPAGEWVKFRMVWNNELKVIKYYCGDMRVPTMVERGNLIGPAPGAPMRLGLRNYGLLPAEFTDRMRNMVYREAVWQDDAKVCRDSVLVFRGMMAESFPVESWAKSFDREHTYDFVLESVGHNIRPDNRFALDALPDEGTLARAKRIFLVDMPLVYRTFPEDAQRQLLAAVQDGAELVITDGPFALEKCGNFDSPIAKALPVTLVDPWTPVKSDKLVKKDFGKGKIIVVNRKGVK